MKKESQQYLSSQTELENKCKLFDQIRTILIDLFTAGVILDTNFLRTSSYHRDKIITSIILDDKHTSTINISEDKIKVSSNKTCKTVTADKVYMRNTMLHTINNPMDRNLKLSIKVLHPLYLYLSALKQIKVIR